MAGLRLEDASNALPLILPQQPLCRQCMDVEMRYMTSRTATPARAHRGGDSVRVRGGMPSDRTVGRISLALLGKYTYARLT